MVVFVVAGTCSNCGEFATGGDDTAIPTGLPRIGVVTPLADERWKRILMHLTR